MRYVQEQVWHDQRKPLSLLLLAVTKHFLTRSLVKANIACHLERHQRNSRACLCIRPDSEVVLPNERNARSEYCKHLLSRRSTMGLTSASCLSFAMPSSALDRPGVVVLPLREEPGGVFTTGVSIDGEPFRVIIDSGSPYLVVPLDDCITQLPRVSAFGCGAPGQFRASSLRRTVEQYGTLKGTVTWLKGNFRVNAAEEETSSFQKRHSGNTLIFGGGDRIVMSQSGGALLGLIRRVNLGPQSTYAASDLRPTAFAQLGFKSFCIDAPRLTLSLSRTSLIGAPSQIDALPLYDPRADGDSVEHICCLVDDNVISINGKKMRTNRPLLCVFDTGLTGCVISKSLVHELGLHNLVANNVGQSSLSQERSNGIRSLQLALRTEKGRQVLLGSSMQDSHLFYAQAISLNWFLDDINSPHIVAIGQCILGRGVLTVDGPQRRAQWSPVV